MSLHSDNQALLRLLETGFERLEAGFGTLATEDTDASSSITPKCDKRLAPILAEVAERMADNYPYFHPLYAGQMLRPPHPIARAAYALAMVINPNNHARDGGRASSQMEIEAVAEIASIFGWRERHLGHLTSGGTFANLEALWVAGQLRPDMSILASTEAHYTHSRISQVLRLPFEPIAADTAGRMNLEALEERLKRGSVGTVVATLGTTGTGAVDPLDGILELQREYGFRIHVDAAYGGYFRLIADELDEPARRAFSLIHLADSIVVDPHKHGLQPYGCGCILFRDPEVGRLYKHNSPYTYFTSKALHLGEISLECSRAGASAVALWATQRLLPLVPGGEFAGGLAASRRAALDLYAQLADSELFILPFPPELDIVVAAVQSNSPRESSRLAQLAFDRSAEAGLHLALLQLPRLAFPCEQWTGEKDVNTILCLRSVLMKSEHELWVSRIVHRLTKAIESPANHL
jgi:glutamate/tyrosine decarboxylase-like PLP-dependent enzyme